MIDIKFRGLREGVNDWVYGDLIHYNELTSIRFYTTLGGCEQYIVKPESVGQLLNVVDGIEIYSNQLLKASWERTSRGRYFQSSDAYIEHNLIGMFEWKNFAYMFKTQDGKFITIPMDAKFEII